MSYVKWISSYNIHKSEPSPLRVGRSIFRQVAQINGSNLVYSRILTFFFFFLERCWIKSSNEVTLTCQKKKYIKFLKVKMLLILLQIYYPAIVDFYKSFKNYTYLLFEKVIKWNIDHICVQIFNVSVSRLFLQSIKSRQFLVENVSPLYRFRPIYFVP